MTVSSASPMLHEFISAHRQELVDRARARVALRAAPRATTEELANGVPHFLTHLSNILKQEADRSAPDGSQMAASATQHGEDLFKRGFTIAQVVQDYGDICQVIAELALDLRLPFATEEFKTLNRCLDSAIADAVTAFSRQRDVGASQAEVTRQGFLAHELRNHLNTAMLAFQVMKSGRVGVTGSTVAVLERSLRSLRDLIDRSVSEVRLASGTHQRQRLHVSQLIEEVGIDASMEAMNRGLQFSVEQVDDRLLVDVDPHLFASAISNLLQNAFKFTMPSSHVWLRTRSTAERVSIEVEDECGGIPPGAADAIFRPFEQRGMDRAGLGLGLTICRQAIEADGGRIWLRNIPGKGCVFIVELPLAVGASAYE